MNWDLMFKAANAIALVASAVLNAYLWFKSKSDLRFAAIEERLEQMGVEAEEDREAVRLAVAERKAHIAELSERVGVIDERLKQLPTHEDLAGINNKLSAVDERSRILLDGMRRIENHLLDR